MCVCVCVCVCVCARARQQLLSHTLVPSQPDLGAHLEQGSLVLHISSLAPGQKLLGGPSQVEPSTAQDGQRAQQPCVPDWPQGLSRLACCWLAGCRLTCCWF